MMKLVLVLCVALVGLCMAREYPSIEAYNRCVNIGSDSGCSGCVADNINCDWCVQADNDETYACLPEGSCEDFGYVSKPHLCPANPAKEPMYINRDATAGEGSSSQETFWSPSFDAMYCDFPREPWTIDRTSNPFGNYDPRGNCYRVNNQLAVGQLNDILECLAPPQKKRDVSETEGQVLGDRLSLKQKECIRLYQSYLCTSSCPEYGVAMDFNYLCHDYCDRLWQHCDEALLGCLYRSQPLPFESCAPKEDSHCFRPNLIPVGHKFEHDLCFYGDTKECSTTDCVVELMPDDAVWPAETYCYNGYGSGANFNPTQTGAACCTDDRVGHNGWLYKIVRHGTAAGLSCEEATHNDWVKRWPERYNGDQHGEACTANYCAAVVDIGTNGNNGDGCNEGADCPDFPGCTTILYNCPGLAGFLYASPARDCDGNIIGIDDK